ncbi:30S ribosomal protein S4e [archaeon]|nr:30S ribosomal protein S4e [archaeon]
MAKKGEKKVMKVFAASKATKVLRRSPSFVTKARAGPHAKDKALPLSIVLRDLMGIAKTAREARVILNERRVIVNGKITKDQKMPIGFMDVISLPSISKHYIMVYNKKGKLDIHETDKPTFKLSRIQNKTMTNKGLQLNLHDGRNMIVNKNEYNTGGTLKLAIPQQKILEYYPMEEGNIAYVTGGKHAGDIAHIQSMLEGTQTRAPLVVLKSKNTEFQTRRNYVFILGTKTPSIKINEEDEA